MPHYVLDARTAIPHFPGIGRYTRSLAGAIVPRLQPAERLTLLVDPREPLQLEGARFVPITASPFSASQQWRVPRALRSMGAGLYHSPYYLMPYLPSTATVLTVYDVIPLRYPRFSSARSRLLFRVTTRLAVAAARHVIAITENARQDFIREFRVPRDKITAIPLGADPSFRPATAAAIAAVRAKHALPKRFVLYLGSNKPHKNLAGLVQAWLRRPSDSAALVVAGAWDDRYSDARRLADESGVSSIRWIGRVPEEELPALYGAAEAFVFPSFFEGFGLPVLEAMACGTPVVCSNVTALPEVAGDAAILVDPADIAAIAAALGRVLDDEALRSELPRKGIGAGRPVLMGDDGRGNAGNLPAGGGVRILHIYKDYHPILGGIENHLKLLAEGQAARGHDVTALVTNPAGLESTETVENGVRVMRAGRLATVASTPLTVALPWRLLRARPDVVHLHFPYPVGETAQWLLRRGRATVLTYHSDVVKQATILKFYRPIMERVLRQVDALIIGSPPMRRSAYLADHQAKLRLIPYGIPLATFRRAEDVRQRDPQAPFTLLFVGRLRYYKGLDTLIRALPRIPARLRVVGIGPMEAEWRELAQELGVSDRVEWLGETPDAALPSVYHSADLFVLPASHPSEAFGLVQVEAMAAGLPVVCTELGTGTTYVNLDGITGLVVAPRDPDALAAAINSLVADPARLAELGRAAESRVAQEFDLDVMVDRVLALYGDLIR